jgi:hypothetical protein
MGMGGIGLGAFGTAGFGTAAFGMRAFGLRGFGGICIFLSEIAAPIMASATGVVRCQAKHLGTGR